MDNLQLVTLSEVCNQTSLGKTSIYTISDFPRPIKLGGAVATMQGGARWVKSEVELWIRGRITLRDASAKPSNKPSAQPLQRSRNPS
jgi:predicted DNA-binding transcriptional regulator AlpA